MAFKLPWSNFHELNLDWLLEKMKELEDKVDSFIGSAVPSDDPPQMDGAASAGSSDNYSRGNHVHPTDTSRASQLYAESIENKVDSLEHDTDIAIREINDILNFSTAAPLVDGIANPGNSQYPARADHVHPTDTSRASKDDFDTLKARVDGFSGSANPSDTVPQMDGIGSAGSGGNYSRGDHVHPSDTSKLDISGGRITGPLQVAGFLTQEKNEYGRSTSSITWRRAAYVPNTPGTLVNLTITRQGENTPPEIHKIDLVIADAGAYFTNEYSDSVAARYINKIRYTDAGYVDIHFEENYASRVQVDIDPHSAAETRTISISDLAAVAIAPEGETIITEYPFHLKGFYFGNIFPAMMNSISFEKNSLTSSGAKVYSTNNGGRDIFIVVANNANTNAIYLVGTTNGGTPNVYTIPAGAGSNIIITTAANSIKFQMNGYNADILHIKLT